MRKKIRNIGPVSMEWLTALGILTINDLKRQGAVKVYCKAKDKGFNVTLNLLYALEASIQDIDWRALPDDVKNKLKRELTDLDKF